MTEPKVELANFERSYKAFESYPNNLICQTSYLYALKALKKRLDEAGADLFVANDSKVDVPFRESLSDGESFTKRNILSDEKLKEWLGDTSVINPDTKVIESGKLATKEDPKCRFIYLHAGHARKQLYITRKMLLRIFSYHQVMPAYLDFISVFGAQEKPRDLRYSGFCEQTFITQGKGPRGPVVEDLGRSGRQFQICYNLKAVTCTVQSPFPKGKKWSIRQAVFHHQFDVGKGTSLFIVTKGDLQIKERIEEMTGQKGRLEDRNTKTLGDCFIFSLKIHLLCCHWSTEEWRWYLQWLEELIEVETHMAKEGTLHDSQARRLYKPDDLQQVQDYEDKANEATMILEANVDIITSLREFYDRMVKNPDFTVAGTSIDDVADFDIKLKDMMYDLKMQVARGKLLGKIVADRKTLILQHLQSQATQKMETMTIMSQKEAVAVRIITVVTLIYLPATFVSTFFSTDIVKYQGQGNEGGSFSDTALYRWLQLSLPLTFLTLVLSFLGYKIAERARERQQLLPVTTKEVKTRFSWLWGLS